MSANAVRWVVSLGVALVLSRPAPAAAQPAASLGVFDTGSGSSAPQKGDVLADRAGWIRVTENQLGQPLHGDAILANDCLTLVFRRGGPGAELYANGPKGLVPRVILSPTTLQEGTRLASVAVVENTTSKAAVDAVFDSPGTKATVRFELQIGQAFVRTKADRTAEGLRVEAPCRFAVLPDFFADDIAVDATELPADKAELPSENFLLHLMGRGEAMVLAVWDQREEDVRVALAGRGKARMIRASEIPYGTEGSVYVAVLESPGIWHSCDVRKADADRVIGLDWKAPYPAQWRVDWRQDDGLTDSWEMLVEQRDGTYARLDWFGQSDAYGTPDWMKPDRKRWTTVLGTFQYPCWIDKEGRGFLQPLKKPGKFQGPALVYPINRAPSTPLTTFTFVDIVRATLGVGPCQYVLDLEGQQKKSEGVPTCATRTRLDGIYGEGQQKQKRAEVEESLNDVLAFMRHIRTRIESYLAFGRQTVAYLEEQKAAHPDLAGFFADMETAARAIEEAVEQRKGSIQTPEYAASLVEEFRTTLVDNEGPDALEKCKKITAGFVKIGGNQDELVGECRLAVKILRQKAALAMAVDPRTAVVAKEIRRRTQAMLRNPTSYEAPRH